MWIEVETGEPGHQWIVLDKTGTQIAAVRVPSAIQVLDVSLVGFWGLRLGPDDLPVITAYALK